MKRIISLLLVVVSLVSVLAIGASAASKFSDVEGHWGQLYVDYYVENGVVNGYPDGTFLPDAKITRAEVSQILLNYFKFTGKGAGFTDVSDSDWYSEAVLASQQNGAFQGYQDGTFKPTNSITREEVIVMLRRITTAEEDLESGKHFLDYYDVCEWAKGSVGALYNVGVLDGYEEIPGTFYVRVHRQITRAEFVKLLYTIEKSANVEWNVPGKPVEEPPVIIVTPPTGGGTTNTYYNVAVSIKRPADSATVAANSRYVANPLSTATSPVLFDIYQTLQYGHGVNVNNPVDASGNPWNYISAFDATFGDAEAHTILRDMIQAYLNKDNNTSVATTMTWEQYVNAVTVTTTTGMEATSFKTEFLGDVDTSYGDVGAGKWDISFTTPVGQQTYVVTIEITSEVR